MVISGRGSVCPNTLTCAKPAQPRQEIEITLPDGAKRKGTSWAPSPMDVAKEISKGLADRIVISKVTPPLLMSLLWRC